jgi:hypothetical protein
MMDKMKLMDAAKRELSKLDKRGGRLEGGGAAIAISSGYVSGFPYLFSGDWNNAFAFRNREQAQSYIDKHGALLKDAKIVVPRHHDATR